MSLWIYDFKQLLNAKNLLITHKSTLEQFFNFLTYFTLIAFAIFKGSKLDPDVFASAEIFFAILFVANVLFTGFY